MTATDFIGPPANETLIYGIAFGSAAAGESSARRRQNAHRWMSSRR
jgi:hypothetical protein